MPARRRPKEQKKAGAEYAVAGGGKIADMGEKLLKFEFSDGDSGHMSFRLANVTKPPGAASSVCDKGNRAVFRSEGSYVGWRAVRSVSRFGGRTARHVGRRQSSEKEKAFLEAGAEAVSPEAREAKVVSGPRAPNARAGKT